MPPEVVTMLYELFGRLHLLTLRAARAARREDGQGTVEYVALILLVAVILAGVVAAARSKGFSTTQIAEAVVKHIKSAMNSFK